MRIKMSDPGLNNELSSRKTCKLSRNHQTKTLSRRAVPDIDRGVYRLQSAAWVSAVGPTGAGFIGK